MAAALAPVSGQARAGQPARSASAGDAVAPPAIYTLESMAHAERGGPVQTTRSGGVLWFTMEPGAPYLSPHVWPMTRIVVRESRDAGISWARPQVVASGTKEYSVLPHTALELRSGKLLHIHVQYSGYDYATASPAKSLNRAVSRVSADGGRTWSAAEALPTGERYISDVLSIVRSSSGRILYPFGFLTDRNGRFSVSVLYSDDDARTWKRSPSVLDVGGTGFESGATEPSIVELPGGRLWMLIRAQTGFLWESFSDDHGSTWQPGAPSRLPSSNAPGTALRLRSGVIAVVWNNHVDSAYARQSLVVGLTRDGRSFTACREIDHTDFPNDPAAAPAHVTYPFLGEAPDGALLVSYNKGHWLHHNRPKLARVDPRWVAAGREIEDFRGGRVGWCTRDPGPHATSAVERYAPAEDGGPGASLEIEQPAKASGPCGITRNIPLLARGEMVLRAAVLRPEASILWQDSMLAPGETGHACVRVRFGSEGRVFIGGGKPERLDRERRGAAYSYLGYPIREEKPYPKTIVPGRLFELGLRVDAASRQASVRIDDGPDVSFALPEVLGLCYFGLAVSEGGALRLRRFETKGA
jgi:hypothetical protein